MTAPCAPSVIPRGIRQIGRNMAVRRRFGLSRPSGLGFALAGTRFTAPSRLLCGAGLRRVLSRRRRLRRHCRPRLLHRQSEQTPPAVDRLKQHLEIDLHRLAGEISLEAKHALRLIETGRLGHCGAMTLVGERSMPLEARSAGFCVAGLDWVTGFSAGEVRASTGPAPKSTAKQVKAAAINRMRAL